MNLSSVILKKIIQENDLDTWSSCPRHYFSTEYHKLYNYVNKHVEDYSEIPSFEDLALSVRDPQLKDTIFALESSDDVDIEASQLLDYLKNEVVQIEIMDGLEDYLEKTIAISDAEENIEALHNIIITVEDRVDLKDPQEDMGRIELFETEEDLEKSIPLGLNDEYDEFTKFGSTDLIMFGGRRGAGKSLTCANIVANLFNKGNSAIYFTIEMTSRATLQRIASISSNVPFNAIKNRNMSVDEWEKVATWWSSRFEDGEQLYFDYKTHRSFDRLHAELTKKPLREHQIDVIYEPSLTIGKIKAELDRKLNTIAPKVIVVDYLNQVKRSNVVNARTGQYDWTEQIEISKALKSMAQEFEIPFVSPYQTDATGEARFAKGILDSPDAVFSLETYNHEDGIISFNCQKMRNGEEISFTSKINWPTLKIGPESASPPGVDSEDGLEEVSDI